MTRQDRDLILLLDAGLPYEFAFEVAFWARLDREMLSVGLQPYEDKNALSRKTAMG